MEDKAGKDLQSKLTTAIPPWALATCSIIFVLGMTLRIIGIDISSPLNTYFGAQAKATEVRAMREAQGEGDVSKELEERLKKLEENSHPVSKGG